MISRGGYHFLCKVKTPGPGYETIHKFSENKGLFVGSTIPDSYIFMKLVFCFFQDEEKLKNERVRALKAKERFAQSTAGKSLTMKLELTKVISNNGNGYLNT